jgi:autoinducer 2-degrading protein
MIVALVALGIRPDAVEAFAMAARANAAASAGEPGCLRFEVYRDAADSTRFLLFEAYRDQAAREAHWATPHFLAYRDGVAELIETRAVTVYVPLASPGPEDADALE